MSFHEHMTWVGVWQTDEILGLVMYIYADVSLLDQNQAKKK